MNTNEIVDSICFNFSFFFSDLEQGKLIWKWYQSIDGSPLADVFMGQFKSSLQCEVCKNVSLTFDPFWDMALPVAVTMVNTYCYLSLLVS